MLWGDGQAANPANALQAQIGQLRRTFGAAAIVTSDAGYALDVQPDQVDVVRFEQLVAKGRRLAAEISACESVRPRPRIQVASSAASAAAQGHRQ